MQHFQLLLLLVLLTHKVIRPFDASPSTPDEWHCCVKASQKIIGDK